MRTTFYYNDLLIRLSNVYLTIPELRREYLSSELRDFEFTTAIIEEEIMALLQGDVPYFVSSPGSLLLKTKRNQMIDHSMEKTAVEIAQEILHKMADVDRSKQARYIQQSIQCLTSSVHDPKYKFRNVNKKTTTPTKDELLSYVISIATELLGKVIDSQEDSLNWVDVDFNAVANQLELKNLSDSLHSGNIGIALFFAALYSITDDEKWKSACIAAILPLRRVISKGKFKRLIEQYGVNEVGSLIYGLIHIGKLLQDMQIHEDAIKLAKSIDRNHIQNESNLDFIHGCTGLLLSLLTINQSSPDDSFLNLATYCGHNLLANLDAIPAGLGGLSGVAFALLKLGKQTNQPNFIEAASDLFSQERVHPLFFQKNSPICSWLNGEAGIGLARCAASRLLKDPLFNQDIEKAINVTLQQLDQGALNLCCGPLPRLEFLREAARTREGLSAPIEKLIHHIYVHSKNNPNEFQPLGLFWGKAGVGYTLLRFIDDKQLLPQVLLFD